MKFHPQYRESHNVGHCKAPQERWRVRQRNHNNSHFHGGYQASDYSGLVCLDCHHCWRSKAAYVMQVSDLQKGDGWP